MSPGLSLWTAGIVAAALSAVFAWITRLPLPFDGFAAVVAAGLAFVGTVTLVTWMPARWVWTEGERLRHAFQARHGVSDYAAGSALEAITTAHARANTLRATATAMREDVAEQVHAVADRLDTAAREIFYTPERQRDLRAVLIRSELIEDAARAHAKLRERAHSETEDASRRKLITAVDALQAAFDQTDLLAARGLLAEVEAASEVAETVLKPRRRIPT
ncbi:MAG: hypothetical protein AAGA06_09685 [Pseudomonadota bacterium]